MLRSLHARDLLAVDLDVGNVLLVLGREDCPACVVMGASAGVIARAWPDLAVWSVQFAEPSDWQARAAVLWPRGVHVSRAAMPSLALLQDGIVTWQGHGAVVAADLVARLQLHLGAPANAVAGIDGAEEQARQAVARRRAQLIRAHGRLAQS